MIDAECQLAPSECECRRIVASRAFHGSGRGRGRREHIANAIRQVTVNGLWLEFGVSTGGSINFIADQTDRIVYGFDWFEGLPEDWVIGSGYHVELRGAYRGRPAFTHANVTLVDGLFDQTLPRFLRTHRGPVAFAHIDCDLYSSTRIVLQALRDRLVIGTVIAFDELYNYPNYAYHEMRALLELADAGIEYTYIGHTADTMAASLQITQALRTSDSYRVASETREVSHLPGDGA